MIEKIRQIKDSPFIRNFLILVSGTAFAQVISVASYPILTRIFSPVEFGDYAIYTSLLNIFGTVVTGRYELAIMLPPSRSEALKIFLVAILIASGFSVAIPILLYIVSQYTSLKLIEDIYQFGFLLVSFFLFGYLNAVTYLSNRLGNYKLISKTKVLQSAGTIAVQLLLGFLALKKWGLTSGYTMGLLLACALATYTLKLKPNGTKTGKDQLTQVASKYKRFLYINAPSSLLDNISLFIPVFFIKMGYGKETLGYYSIALRMATLPATLIGQAVAQIFFKKISALYHNRPAMLSELNKTVRMLFLVGLPIAIGMATLSPFVFRIVFGSTWEVAGRMLQVISISFLIRFVVSPISSVFIATEQLGLLARWQLCYFFLLSLASYFGIKYLSVIDLLFLYAGLDIVIYLYYYYLIRKSIK